VKRTQNWNHLATLVSPYFAIELKIALCKHPTLSCYYNYAVGVSLETVMSFFSGADDIPHWGYPHEPLINFNPDSAYPTASTCTLQLTLPTCYSEYLAFKRALDTAFTMHGGFGMS